MTEHTLFGTDGIRGEAGKGHITPSSMLQLADAACMVLQKHFPSQIRRVVIGKDTRLSGYMLEQALAAGFTANGYNVLFTGPLPTPALAHLTQSLRADLGIMITASHNPYTDNGIKLFGANGKKLNDEIEADITEAFFGNLSNQNNVQNVGRATRVDDVVGRYIETIKQSLPKDFKLSGLKIVLDTANGAAYKIAPEIFWELKADIIKIGNTPNGRNINDAVGATQTDLLQKRVVEEKADIGIAFDGDADRLIMVNEKGEKIDGDQILGRLALYMKSRNYLHKNTLVATVMSNLGLENTMKDHDISFIRTAVGDRHVAQEMWTHGYNLGGEQAGHIILSDHAFTGDGILAALHALQAMRDLGHTASQAFHVFDPVPQLLENVRFKTDSPLDSDPVKAEIAKAEKRLDGTGRLLIRQSGTEPLIRIMAEGHDQNIVNDVVHGLKDFISKSISA